MPTLPLVQDPAKAKEVLHSLFRAHHKGKTPSGQPSMNCQLPTLVSDLGDEPAWLKCPLRAWAFRTKLAPALGRLASPATKGRTRAPVTRRSLGSSGGGLCMSSGLTRPVRPSFVLASPSICSDLLERFEPFRWPRPDEKARKPAVKFVKAWACLKCHAPFEQDKGAEEHVPAKCPTTLSPKRLPGLVKRRLSVLAALKAKFETSKVTGIYRQQGLAAFAQAASVLARPTSPCF